MATKKKTVTQPKKLALPKMYILLTQDGGEYEETAVFFNTKEELESYMEGMFTYEIQLNEYHVLEFDETQLKQLERDVKYTIR